MSWLGLAGLGIVLGLGSLALAKTTDWLQSIDDRDRTLAAVGVSLLLVCGLGGAIAWRSLP